MLETKSDIKTIIQSYLKVLNKKGLSSDKLFLFGSYSKGTATPESDIDLIMVSSDFSGMPLWQRWEILGDALTEIMEPIEILAYSPEEFELERNKQAGFLNHILRLAETAEIRL